MQQTDNSAAHLMPANPIPPNMLADVIKLASSRPSYIAKPIYKWLNQAKKEQGIKA